MSFEKVIGEMLIRPEDALYVIHDADNDARIMQMPQGPEQGNEFGDTVYHKGGFVPYHDHDKGFETFLASGPVDTIINGKRFIMEKGDIIQIRPHISHFFRHLEEGSNWREMFTGVQMYSAMAFREYMEMYSPELTNDEEFQARRKKRYSGSYFRKEEPVAEAVSKYEIPELKPAGKSFMSYEFPGVTLNLKIGRWEYEGIKEIWEVALKKGAVITWGEPHGEWDLFWMLDGRVKVETDSVSFFAKEKDIINIHPYAKHKLIALEDTTLLACNVRSWLFRALEELKVEALKAPEKWTDKEFVLKLLEKHDCMVTDFEYKPAEEGIS